MNASPRFPLGQTLATPGVLACLQAAGLSPLPLIARHVAGDWGDLGPEDKEMNESALRDGGRIFSAYQLPTGGKVWVITEADRSATTTLLPEEY